MAASQERVPLANQLKFAFQSGVSIPPDTERHLAEALAETLQRTGNFIRAQLAYHIALSYGVSHENSLDLAISLEYFHTASLIFDDLPSMDDATHRRGAVCLHRLYGEGPAILTGLGLINRAYALLWRALTRAGGAKSARALEYLEQYLGLGGLLNGQSQDLHYAKLPKSERSPHQVAIGKTVALIRLSMVLPALAGGASDAAVRGLDRLAVIWGLAYQALDDLKDVLHGPERAGKTTDRDRLLDRPNLALSLGADAALARLEKLTRTGERGVTMLERHEPALACLDRPRARLHAEVEALAKEFAGAPV